MQSHSDLDCVGSIPSIPNTRYVPSLLCHEQFNEASLPVAKPLCKKLYTLFKFITRSEVLVSTPCRELKSRIEFGNHWTAVQRLSLGEVLVESEPWGSSNQGSSNKLVIGITW
jgi:hypothetical protein